MLGSSLGSPDGPSLDQLGWLDGLLLPLGLPLGETLLGELVIACGGAVITGHTEGAVFGVELELDWVLGLLLVFCIGAALGDLETDGEELAGAIL